MPSPNVAVPHREFATRTHRLNEVVGGLKGVDPPLQRMVAELVMLRLFDELQEGLLGVATRLACGAAYVDGTRPKLLTAPATSTQRAEELFKNFNRTKTVTLRWSKAKYIVDATQFVLDPGDPFVHACTTNGSVLAEMRVVRNRIAHANAGTRSAYAKVIRQHYGAKVNGLAPGTFLRSPRFHPTKLEQYLGFARVIVRGCARA